MPQLGKPQAGAGELSLLRNLAPGGCAPCGPTHPGWGCGCGHLHLVSAAEIHVQSFSSKIDLRRNQPGLGVLLAFVSRVKPHSVKGMAGKPLLSTRLLLIRVSLRSLCPSMMTSVPGEVTVTQSTLIYRNQVFLLRTVEVVSRKEREKGKYVCVSS